MFLPQVCTASPVMTLNVLLQDWTLIQRQYEENSAYKLNDATSQEESINKSRKSTTPYPFDEAYRTPCRPI